MAFRIGSWLLVGVAIGLVAWFLWSASSFDASGPSPPGLDRTVAATTSEGAVDVNRTTLLTADKQNRPFLVRAERAVQSESKPDEIDLENVTGEMERDGNLLKFRADRAVYDNKSDNIDLSGNVEVVSPREFVATLRSARVSLTDRHVTSQEPVHVAFDGGTIDAGGVVVYDDGARIVFKNRVRTLIRSNEGQVDQVQ